MDKIHVCDVYDIKVSDGESSLVRQVFKLIIPTIKIYLRWLLLFIMF